jgi:hypothetical protein
MATNAAAPPVSGIKKFTLTPQVVDTSVIKDHGAQLVETKTVYDMRLRTISMTVTRTWLTLSLGTKIPLA